MISLGSWKGSRKILAIKTFITSINHSISGIVSGDTQSDVTITLSDDASTTTTTDSGGNYSFSNIANGSYTITPNKSGYTFSQPSENVTISYVDQSEINFTANQSTSSNDMVLIPAGTFQMGNTFNEGLSIEALEGYLSDIFKEADEQMKHFTFRSLVTFKGVIETTEGKIHYASHFILEANTQGSEVVVGEEGDKVVVKMGVKNVVEGSSSMLVGEHVKRLVTGKVEKPGAYTLSAALLGGHALMFTFTELVENMQTAMSAVPMLSDILYELAEKVRSYKAGAFKPDEISEEIRKVGLQVLFANLDNPKAAEEKFNKLLEESWQQGGNAVLSSLATKLAGPQLDMEKLKKVAEHFKGKGEEFLNQINEVFRKWSTYIGDRKKIQAAPQLKAAVTNLLGAQGAISSPRLRAILNFFDQASRIASQISAIVATDRSRAEELKKFLDYNREILRKLRDAVKTLKKEIEEVKKHSAVLQGVGVR